MLNESVVDAINARGSEQAARDALIIELLREILAALQKGKP